MQTTKPAVTNKPQSGKISDPANNQKHTNGNKTTQPDASTDNVKNGMDKQSDKMSTAKRS